MPAKSPEAATLKKIAKTLVAIRQRADYEASRIAFVIQVVKIRA